MLGFILGAGAIIVFLFFVYMVIAYVLTAIALQTLADSNGLEYPWLAWIPIANLYILGLLVKDETNIPYIEWILPGGSLILSLFGDFLFGILSLAMFVISIMALYVLYKKYSDSFLLLTVLSIIFPFLIPFFLFAIRNNV